MGLLDIKIMTDKIIETFDLSKIYQLKGRKKEIRALDDVNISINKGDIFGFLGPNGAGKTTMIQILTTLLQPTSGYALIDGYNILKKPKKAKSKVSLMLESDMLYYRITAYDNLKFFCKIYNVSNYDQKIRDMTKAFGLEKWLNQYVEKFSSGMKMKLALLRTLLLDRDIMFLDEPTLGLDVKSKNFIIEILRDVKKTIFLTSHDMGVVEKLCNRVAFINNGKILKIGTKEDIQQLKQTEVKINLDIHFEKRKLKSELKNQDFINEIIDSKNGFLLELKGRDNYKDLLSILVKYDITGINEQKESLEESFLKII